MRNEVGELDDDEDTGGGGGCRSIYSPDDVIGGEDCEVNQYRRKK